MAENEKDEIAVGDSQQSEIPISRIKRIMKLDKDINRVNSEALYLISRSTHLFLESLAEKSAEVALEKKRKTIRLDHTRIAIKRHQPTSDFLLDSFPAPSEPSNKLPQARSHPRTVDKPPPIGTRRIDAFFQKCS